VVKLVTAACVAVSIPVLTFAASLAAQRPTISGTFRLVVEQSDNLDGAIEAAIAPMNFVIRPFARRRLRKITTLHPTMVIKATADTVEVIAEPHAPIRTAVNGTPILWRREDGEPFTVTGVWDGAVFQHTFVSGTGRRVNRYSLSTDGQTLTVRVVITGGGLPGAMPYTIVYKRVS